jgi:hypothetical protein
LCGAEFPVSDASRATLNRENGTMKSLNTKLALSALGVALLATPAFAQKPHHHRAPQLQTQFQNPRSDDVVVDGHVIGADPDPQIRSQLSREYEGLQGD